MKDPRYQMPAEKRKFGNKVYSYLEWRKLKKEAESVAERFEEKGYPAKIAKFGGGWSVYVLGLGKIGKKR